MIEAEQLHARILSRLDMTRDMEDEELTELIYEVLQEASQEEYLPLDQKTMLGKELFNAFRKLDLLQEFLEDEQITEIMINGTQNIFIEKAGRIIQSDKRFLSRDKLDVTIPEVLTISSLSLSIILGNTFDNAIEACCSLPAEQRTIHLQLRKQYRSLFYRLENPYSDTSRGIRIGEHHGYGLKNINRIVQENHGDFYTKKKDGVFTVQVRLNCEN